MNKISKLKTKFAITILLTLAVIVLINYLNINHHIRIDTTQTHIYSLSPKTLTVLNLLKNDINATYFYRNTPYDATGDILKEYELKSKKFKLYFYNPDRNPEITSRYGIKSYETLVLSYNDKFKRLDKPNEQDITNAIIQLINDKKKKILFSAGHGEHLPFEYNRNGISKINDLINEQNFKTDTIVLAKSEKISKDYDVLVINGSNKQWTKHELNLLNRYVENGGNLFINIDSNVSGINTVLRKLGVKITDATVIDKTDNLANTGVGITTLINYGFHEITDNFHLMTSFEMPKQILKLSNKESKNYKTTILLSSSTNSWGETGTVSDKSVFDEDSDIPGPIVFGVVINTGKSKIVLISDSDYATNSYIGFAGNSDLYINILSWLTQQEDLIEIQSKGFAYQIINAPKKIVLFFFAFGVIGIPLIIITTGIFVWIKKKL